MRVVLLTAACAACVAGSVLAQGEKVTISAVPKAGSRIHYTVTQGSSVAGSSEGGSAEHQPPKPSVTFGGTSVTSYTVVTGDPDERGRITGQVTVVQGTTEVRHDGSSRRSEESLLAGKTFTILFGDRGQVIDLTSPLLNTLALDTLRRQIAELFTPVPTTALSVGETVELPIALVVPATPLPLGPFDITGRATLTLVSVEARGSERIAHCAQSFEATVTQRPDAAVSLGRHYSSDTIVRGHRTVELDVNRNIVKASQMEATFDSTRTEVDPKMPKFKTQGVVRATITAKY